MPFSSNQRSWSATYSSTNEASPPRACAILACSLAQANTTQLRAIPSPRRRRPMVYESRAEIRAKSALHASVTSFAYVPVLSNCASAQTSSITENSLPELATGIFPFAASRQHIPIMRASSCRFSPSRPFATRNPRFAARRGNPCSCTPSFSADAARLSIRASGYAPTAASIRSR